MNRIARIAERAKAEKHVAVDHAAIAAAAKRAAEAAQIAEWGEAWMCGHNSFR